MPDVDPVEARKRAAAEAAVAEVAEGMLVGLGTGSTAIYAIVAIGARVRGGLSIEAVATSERSRAAAIAAGIAAIERPGDRPIDLAIDGVDEIDGGLRAIKGAGGAMLREKVVAAAATRMIAIADMSKAVDRLGGKPVPVEVLPFAQHTASRAIMALGGEPVLRLAGGSRALSDQANLLLDCRFPTMADPAALASRLSAVPGLLGHGLFLDEIDALYLGTDSGVVRRDRTGHG